MGNKEIVDFIFELAQLKRIRHEGWRLIGIEDPESVAAHTARAIQIGFILAKMEKYENPFEICSILAFHEIAECRTGDIHRIANRYIQLDDESAVKDQLKKLDFGEEIFELWKQIKYKNTRAGIIAKDADLLEMAFTAKEYIERGHTFAQDWISNISKRLQTDSAKNLLAALEKSNSNDWWQGLKKF
ncbi:MAG: HD domain-containing protein [Candidatus Parvarchaeota archaeon]|nr:HD domain-containing protein [Candidatus Jingweiarchaeum tengchongense]MCW1298227.1 HD domain-containing protein [Candidatus Jingweiarchaeum tengchongense]MCW1300025.1 HD domain-containing protein [Candidatus Jingweiarchaeum tengchongense]MCW1304836.1 HD domain-containing protein [Candidatus Jingweiarchaeum tengchongense]MCW1305426.1 HD domain-containing protein [Candidatus Jingweiarchaeum tengchongense]